MIGNYKNQQLADNICSEEMGAPVRHNLTRTAKYTNVPYQHTGRMTRLKIWYSIYTALQREKNYQLW